ncbi:hypothetical protein FSP39_016690 [Pinctada imbricata]|uniref:Secreted protein n=1 Tax=Pinctada imbricata TaxID=66713 RepID=A0AA89BKU7_PINIB|nr:hypothetical protein FSP39_016690 [Pinctada imbricata]
MKTILALLVVVAVYLALIHASCISRGQCTDDNGDCVDNGGTFLHQGDGWCFNMTCTVESNDEGGYNAYTASFNAWQGMTQRRQETPNTTSKHKSQKALHKPKRPIANRYRLRMSICHASRKWCGYPNDVYTTLPLFWLPRGIEERTIVVYKRREEISNKTPLQHQQQNTKTPDAKTQKTSTAGDGKETHYM